MNLPKPIARWVLLIDKIESGPYNEEEVHALLDEGLVRPNDIAYAYPSDTKSPSWRFLWQFEPFERRRYDEVRAPAENASTPLGEALKERRSAEPEKIRIEKVRSLAEGAVRIPSYDKSIDPGAVEGGDPLQGWSIPPEEAVAREERTGSSVSGLRAVGFFLAVGAIGATFWALHTKFGRSAARVPQRGETSAAPPIVTSAPTASLPAAASAPSPVPPSATGLPGQRQMNGFLPPPAAPMTWDSSESSTPMSLVPTQPMIEWTPPQNDAPPPDADNPPPPSRAFDPTNSMNPFNPRQDER